jgi:hypothetical protein
VTLRPVAVALVVVGIGCSSRAVRPAGPPPEYEPPVVTPWDAGRPSDQADPFADAAEGEWTTEPGDEPGPADAGSEGGAPADDAGEGG